MSTFLPLSFLAPLVLLAAAAFAAARPGRRPGPVPRISEAAALGALALAGIAVVQLLLAGPVATDGALPLRLDAISATMTLLVAFIGWIVMRYSRTYLDGEAREGAFHGLMLATDRKSTRLNSSHYS